MNRYSVIKEIGRGSSSTVWLAKDRETNGLVAMKKCHLSYYRSISKSTDDIFEMAYREARLLKSIHHPNVISCLDYFIDGSYLCMILEYMASGDLEDFIDYFKRSCQLIPEKVILQILRDCMYGLQCLHSQSIVHRDIKPQNLFLREGRVKIGDLGVAATFTASTSQQTCSGTVQYMAPEMIKGEPYAFSADIWSLGCVAYEMMWRKPLFNKGSYSELVTQIIEQTNPVVVSFPGIYSQKLCKIVLSMLNVSKDARPCDDEILSVIQSNDDLLRGYEERLFFERAFKSVVMPSIPYQDAHSGLQSNVLSDECQINPISDPDRLLQHRFQTDAEFVIRNNKGLFAIYKSLCSK